MNALLINPAFPDTFWSFKHALKFVRKRAAFPPLGLLTVAAMLPRPWDKRLVDTNVRPLTKQDLAWADYALVGGMTVQRESARQIIARCKRAGVLVIAGGPLFTAEHEDFDQVDHFVLNEAELTLPPFLADLAGGHPRRIYTTTEFADITRTPTPLWALADLRQYASMSMQFSRGCPFDCEFCNVTALFGHKPRTRTHAQITAELDLLHQLGWRGPIFVVDDNLIGNKKALKATLLPALTGWKGAKRHLSLQTEVSINLADDERLMRLMVEAGFDTVFIGIETPDEQGLAECNKRQNRNRDLVEDVKKIHRAGMQVQGGFIVGFDSDTPTIFQRQIDFIQRSGIVMAMVGLLQAPIGTRLYERLKKEGRLVGRWTGDNVAGTTNVQTLMHLDLLHDGYRRILDHIYAPQHYYQRTKTFLRDYRPPKVHVAFQLAHGVAFLRSVLHLGILNRGRFHYWKLLAWTFFRRRRLVPLAVTLWIYGHHFRKICRLDAARSSGGVGSKAIA